MEAWPTWKMTLNMPKLGLTSFLSLSRTQKTVGPKILEIWDTLIYTLTLEMTGTQEDRHFCIACWKVEVNKDSSLDRS